MSASSSRLGARLSSSALALVSLCVLVLAAVVDRTLTDRAREATIHGSVEAAASLSSYLAVRSEALGVVHGVVAEGPAPGRTIAELLPSDRERLGDFRAVWASDSLGVIRDAASPITPGSSRAAADVMPPPETLAALVTRARGAHFVRFSGLVPIGRGARGVVLLEPVRSRGRVVGFAGASLDSAMLALALRKATPPASPRVSLVAGTDTLVVLGRARAGALPAMARVVVPDGATWQMLVDPPMEPRALRATLWLVTTSALALLAVALVYERAQARRIADRSAELERLSEELIQANRSKSEFLANVSHELRTPLNAIVGFADLLRDGVYGELAPRQVGPVERIEASANHLRQLVDQILDLAKMAAGRLEVHPETVDLRPFVFQVASEMESLVQEKGLMMSLAIGATLPRVRTDPTHLRQILVNLVGNAVKFTSEGGITLRARLVAAGNDGPHDPPGSGHRHHGGGSIDERGLAALARLRDRSTKSESKWLALQVTDTGIGIAEKDRDRIFDEFEQVNAGPRGDSMRRGTGLGLPISRRLARLLGGDITVESEPGRGSAFTLWLPVE